MLVQNKTSAAITNSKGLTSFVPNIPNYHNYIKYGFGYNAGGIVAGTMPGSQKESPAVFGSQRLGAAG
ncbi:hypothetical protein WN943_025801 [Citrus x changshan-huyou]